ncbi:hypothetical protein CIPAW_06G170200 [Carya illinoinensis]|uniref:Uncharacterized protein n=1 Tax=Carya illinoinensis TaxID=32201 RepID=A0A8T1QCI4_CARIL|nr:hypothetical protein CIPAW_06G170200 [Carya illinoinensis]
MREREARTERERERDLPASASETRDGGRQREESNGKKIAEKRERDGRIERGNYRRWCILAGRRGIEASQQERARRRRAGERERRRRERRARERESEGRRPVGRRRGRKRSSAPPFVFSLGKWNATEPPFHWFGF